MSASRGGSGPPYTPASILLGGRSPQPFEATNRTGATNGHGDEKDKKHTGASDKPADGAEVPSSTSLQRGSSAAASKTAESDHGGESSDVDRSSPRKHRVKVRPYVSARLPLEPSSSFAAPVPARGTSPTTADSDTIPEGRSVTHQSSRTSLIDEIRSWLEEEKAKKAARRDSKRDPKAVSKSGPQALPGEEAPPDTDPRRASDASESSLALGELERILERSVAVGSFTRSSGRRRPTAPRHVSSFRKLRRQSSAASSDTEYQDGEAFVPSVDAVLDNSKTIPHSGVAPKGSSEHLLLKRGSAREREAWATFKFEIVRLTHTLGLKGWRRVPMDKSDGITVQRLSGALTNAVYVVSPPAELPLQTAQDGGSSPAPRKPLPAKILLRIYGPNVSHLIDREAELQILRRLARQSIGPRLLGTFTNGRFEEYFHARALTAQDLRAPGTSKQIAKRMRELHEGIELLQEEREGGAFVWRNWDKWVDRCETVVSWLDERVKASRTATGKSKKRPTASEDFVCAVEWPVFRRAVARYRTWLFEQCEGVERVNERLVFAHNDTQYGNILRIIPTGESPLLLAANEHKQLVVIDFEYANANVPGLEFANHFTEWCYNYHSAQSPHSLTHTNYPTPEEQHRFIRAYVLHQPALRNTASTLSSYSPALPPGYHTPPFGLNTPSSSSVVTSAGPQFGPTPPPSSSLAAFVLDARTPNALPPPAQRDPVAREAERERDAETEDEVRRLLRETRLWRAANSAQWVAWGIVQAKIEGMPAEKDEEKEENDGDDGEDDSDGDSDSEEESDDEDASGDEAVEAAGESCEFDYLAYARDRALFFWGDMLRLGLVRAEELPQDVVRQAKVVNY